MDAAYPRLSLLTDPTAVHRAIAEYDALGRDEFLARYGFGRAREYVLVHDGREYDSKAIAGVALAYQVGVEQPLPRTAFSGGLEQAVGRLRALGFEVQRRVGDDQPGKRRRIGGIADDLTADVVHEALAQFHRLGREDFLRRYDAHPAERYVIVEQGREADAKAVVHAAWQLAHPGQTPPPPAQVRGDRPTVADPLRRLGFFVLNTREGGGEEPPLGPKFEAYVDAARKLDVLDRAGRATSRAEQSLLRGALGLFSGAVHDCELCGRHLPASLLVAAHIKRRTDCDHDERRDVLNVAMRACALGCDALFERGLLQVTSDASLWALDPAATPDLADHLATLRGRRAPAFRAARADYFAWHRAAHSGRRS